MSTIKVAIIDDEHEILTMIERYFSRKEGYKVTTFANPLQAIASKSMFDVIFLDIMMPQMNGLDVLPKLLENAPEAKVIMMTAYSTLDKVLKSHRGGATHYIMKPFSSLNVLEEKIREVLA